MRKKRFIRKSVVESQGKLPGDSRIAADEIERTRYDIMLARLESLRHGSFDRAGVEADGDDAAAGVSEMDVLTGEEDKAAVSESMEAFPTSRLADSEESDGGIVNDIVDDEGADVVFGTGAEDAGTAAVDERGDVGVDVNVACDVDAAGNVGDDGSGFREKTTERFVVNKQLLNAESADVMLMQDIIVEIVMSDINVHLKRQPS